MPPTAALQHTIVRTRDAEATARLLSSVAGLRVGKNKINTLYGRRGVYFKDAASGHVFELMTVFYGDPKEVDEVLERLKAEEEEEEEKKKEKRVE